MDNNIINNDIPDVEIDFKNFIENLPVAAYQVDHDGKIVYCNKAFAEMFGFASPKDIFGINIHELFAKKKNIHRFERKLEKAEANQTLLLDFRLEVKKNTGERFLAYMDCYLLKDHKGNIIGRQVTFLPVPISIEP